MGYYTKYDLELKYDGNDITKKDIMTVLSQINPYFSEDEDFDLAFDDEMKWYNYEQNMIELSKCFPEVLFILHGEGEEREDNWYEYFKAGKQQICRGMIIYEPFNPDLFNEEEDNG